MLLTLEEKKIPQNKVVDREAAVKQSIIPKPMSPVSTAWDNPFPTFPTGRSKQKPTEGRTLSDDLGETKNQDGVSEKGSSEGRHQRKVRDKESSSSARGQDYVRDTAEQGSRDHRYHSPQDKVNHRRASEQQGEVDQTRITPESAQPSVRRPGLRPAYDDRVGRHVQAQGRRDQMSGQSGNMCSGPPLPPVTVFSKHSQRSVTLPGELSAMTLVPDPHQGFHPSDWQEPGPTGAYYGPDSHIIISQRPATPGGQWSSERDTSGLADATHDYKGSTDHVSKHDLTKGHLREYSLEDFVDSYSAATAEYPNTRPAGPERWPSLENEMPNFDVATTASADESRELTFDYHLPPQGSGLGFVAGHSSTIRNVEMHEEPYSVEPASRSIFQPDHGGPSQARTHNGADFVFELVGDAPAVLHGITNEPDGRTPYPYEQVSVMSQRQYNDQPGQHNKPGKRLKIESSMAAGVFDNRRQDDWQRHARNPQIPSLPRQQQTPALRVQTRARADHPHSSRSPIDQPPSVRPPSSNPDVLPEHPTPVRPGLMQGAMGSQVPKPRPVRQYDNSPSPIQQTHHTPQKIQSRASQEKAGQAPVTLDELEKLRQVIRANPKDQKTQLLLARKLVKAASILADEGGRADPKARSKNREKYIFDAHKIIKKLVSSGNADAMFYLADCYGRGLLGLENDDKEAFTLYQSAAKAGHAQSAYRVAVCCEMGQEGGGGTRRDPSKAMQWYKRAAMLGDTPAMYKMGMILLKGLLGQPRNSREAIVWLKRAADRADEENPHALHELVCLPVSLLTLCS